MTQFLTRGEAIPILRCCVPMHTLMPKPLSFSLIGDAPLKTMEANS